jgi:hypothetical protein
VLGVDETDNEPPLVSDDVAAADALEFDRAEGDVRTHGPRDGAPRGG